MTAPQSSQYRLITIGDKQLGSLSTGETDLDNSTEVSMKRLRTMKKALLTGAAAALAICGLVATPVALATSSVTVAPRVHCGGFNGHVVWGRKYGSQIPYIHVWGELWSTCNSDSQLYVSFRDPGYRTAYLWTTLGGEPDTQGVNWDYTDWHNLLWVRRDLISDITVQVCNNSGGGHCVPWRV